VCRYIRFWPTLLASKARIARKHALTVQRWVQVLHTKVGGVVDNAVSVQVIYDAVPVQVLCAVTFRTRRGPRVGGEATLLTAAFTQRGPLGELCDAPVVCALYMCVHVCVRVCVCMCVFMYVCVPCVLGVHRSSCSVCVLYACMFMSVCTRINVCMHACP
jgi:hypothetical protein